MKLESNQPLVYKFGDPMCPKCGCNLNCVCHVEGEGGCIECPNECDYEKTVKESTD